MSDSTTRRSTAQPSSYGRIAALCVAIALFAGVTAGIGAFARGDGSTAEAVSIRGEHYEYATSGVYAHNAERVVAEGVGWDWVTLFLAVPALLLTAPAVARGSLRGRLLATGLLAYLFYQYLMYAVYWAFGPLFLPFVLLYSASIAGIVWIVSTIDVTSLQVRFDRRFPRKTMAVACVLMALLLTGMWGVLITAAYTGDFEAAALQGMPTFTVQALDLGIVVPLALCTAILAWRRHAWGYLLVPVLAVKGVSMAAAICAMLISAALVEGSLETASFAVFALATLVFGAIAWRTFASVTDAAGADLIGTVSTATAEV